MQTCQRSITFSPRRKLSAELGRTGAKITGTTINSSSSKQVWRSIFPRFFAHPRSSNRGGEFLISRAATRSKYLSPLGNDISKRDIVVNHYCHYPRVTGALDYNRRDSNSFFRPISIIFLPRGTLLEQYKNLQSPLHGITK